MTDVADSQSERQSCSRSGEPGGSDPDGYVAASTRAVINFNERRISTRQKVKLGFVPFGVEHSTIGKEDKGNYRLLDAEVVTTTFFDNDRLPTVLLETDEGERFALADKKRFLDDENMADEVWSVLLGEAEYVLARTDSATDAYERVGSNVALYVPEGTEEDVQFGEERSQRIAE